MPFWTMAADDIARLRSDPVSRDAARSMASSRGRLDAMCAQSDPDDDVE